LELVENQKIKKQQQSEIMDSMEVLKDISERMLTMDSNNEKYLFYRIL